METDNRCLNCAESASYMGVSISTFKRMVKKKEAPPPIRLSKRRVVWDKKQLDAFIEKMAEC